MENTGEVRKIEIDRETLKYLNTSRRWAMFLAVTGYIFLGLFIASGILAGTFLSAFNTGKTDLGLSESFTFILVPVISIIFFIPLLFLYRFSKHSAHAVQKENEQEFKKALKNLRSYFVYLGIMVIVVLSLYIVVLIVAGTSIAFLKGLG